MSKISALNERIAGGGFSVSKIKSNFFIMNDRGVPEYGWDPTSKCAMFSLDDLEKEVESIENDIEETERLLRRNLQSMGYDLIKKKGLYYICDSDDSPLYGWESSSKTATLTLSDVEQQKDILEEEYRAFQIDLDEEEAIMDDRLKKAGFYLLKENRGYSVYSLSTGSLVTAAGKDGTMETLSEVELWLKS